MSRQISQSNKPAPTDAAKAGQGGNPNPEQGDKATVTLTLEAALAKIAALEEAGGIAATDLDAARNQRDAAFGELASVTTERDALASQLKTISGDLDTARRENDVLKAERDGLAEKINGIAAASKAAYEASAREATRVVAAPTWRREEPLSKAEAALADKLRVDPADVFSINVERGVIVTSSGHAVRAEGDA